LGMALRRRKREGLELDKILDPYQASVPPTGAGPSAIANIRCWSCNRPTIYDARRPRPLRCVWCRTRL
jgi:hypothetical protein